MYIGTEGFIKNFTLTMCVCTKEIYDFITIAVLLVFSSTKMDHVLLHRELNC